MYSYLTGPACAVGRLRREIVFEYDDLHRRTAEKWYDGVSLVSTIAWEYNAAGDLAEVSDANATYEFAYDDLGRVTD